MLTEHEQRVLASMTVPQLTATIGQALRVRDLDLVELCLTLIDEANPQAAVEVRAAIAAAAGRLAS